MPTGKDAKKKTAVKTVKGIHVRLFVLGANEKSIGVKAGTTLGGFRAKHGLEAISVAINSNKTPSDSTVLNEGDRIAVVPQAKGGRK